LTGDVDCAKLVVVGRALKLGPHSDLTQQTTSPNPTPAKAVSVCALKLAF